MTAQWPPIQRPALSSSDAHVWRATLDVTPAELAALERLLFDDERARIARLRFPRDRRRRVAGRARLRQLLSRYLACDPRGITLTYNAYGKPALHPRYGVDAPSFSMSYAGEMALIGVTIGRQIGIDIEAINSDVEVDAIAERYFSMSDLALLRNLPVRQQVAVFFTCWTRKEAYVKATGHGITADLRAFDVGLDPERPPAAVRMHDAAPDRSLWSLRDVPVARGFAAALVVEGPCERIVVRDVDLEWHISQDSPGSATSP